MAQLVKCLPCEYENLFGFLSTYVKERHGKNIPAAQLCKDTTHTQALICTCTHVCAHVHPLTIYIINKHIQKQ